MKNLAKLAWIVFSLSHARAAESEILLEPVDEERKRTVPIKVYLPASTGPQPVVLFSHGLGGSREGNSYLGTHWAKNGYVAVFLQHPGSDESVWRDTPPRERMTALKEAANGANFLARLFDVRFVIDQLERWNAEEEHPLAGRLDIDHIGMSGHSFGARTTQTLMGQRFGNGRSLGDPRLDAFLPLSPSVGRNSPGEAFGHISAPVLAMTGTLDDSPINPETTPDSRPKMYAALPPGDKYQVVFDKGQHFDFGDSRRNHADRSPRIHPAVQQLSTLFWDAYLRQDETAKAKLRSPQLREEAGLVAKDAWDWK